MSMSRCLFMLVELPRQAMDDRPHIPPSCCLIQSWALSARCQEIASEGTDVSGKFDPQWSLSQKRNFHPQSRQVVREGGNAQLQKPMSLPNRRK